MSGVSSVKVKRSELSDEMVWCSPDLDMGVMRDRDEPNDETKVGLLEQHHSSASTRTCHPERT